MDYLAQRRKAIGAFLTALVAVLWGAWGEKVIDQNAVHALGGAIVLLIGTYGVHQVENKAVAVAPPEEA